MTEPITAHDLEVVVTQIDHMMRNLDMLEPDERVVLHLGSKANGVRTSLRWRGRDLLHGYGGHTKREAYEAMTISRHTLATAYNSIVHGIPARPIPDTQ